VAEEIVLMRGFGHGRENTYFGGISLPQ